MSNEVFIGAGASVSLIPETYLNVGEGTVDTIQLESAFVTSQAGITAMTHADGISRSHLVRVPVGSLFREVYKLIPDLYTGCMAKIVSDITVHAEIAYNSTDALYFTGVASDYFTGTVTDVEIQPFGAPCPAPYSVKSYESTSVSTGSSSITVADSSIYNVGDKLYKSATIQGSNLLGIVGSIHDSTTIKMLANGQNGGISSAALYVDEGRILNSDNWLGLVNSFSPPSVDVEMKQLNLAFGDSRDFGFQFKGAETVSGASLDVSLNNMSWLYYALGSISALDAETTGTAYTNADTTNITMTANSGHVDGDVLFNDNTNVDDISGPFFHKVLKGSGNAVEAICPPLRAGTTTGNVKEYTPITTANFSTNKLNYTLNPANAERLPSFALELTYRKESDTTKQVDVPSGSYNLNDGTVVTRTSNQNVYGRVITGNQVNTLTLNFEEGQEVKASVDIASRRQFDVPNKYIIQRSVDSSGDIDTTDTAVSSLFNFSATRDFNLPFQYFDGAMKIFGTNFARVKTASITINNNLTQQRYVGTYNRQIMSEHIPAQRTYEISATCLITDTKIWDELRSQTEQTGANKELEFNFQKDTGETFSLQFQDYVISAVDVPLPDDKGPVEVSVTIMARTLATATYTGGWIIQG